MKNPSLRLAAAAALALASACGSDSDVPSAPTPSVAVAGVALDNKALTLRVGGTGVLTALVMPPGAANRDVAWSCEGEAATVSCSAGAATVTARGVGTATVRVSASEGGWTDDCLVTVTDGAVAVTGVSLDKAAMGLVPGSAGVLTAVVRPADATDRNIAWASSNTAVATVAGGEGATAWVTAAGSGSATITATTSDGGFAATCAVTVAPYVVPVVGMGMDKPSMELPVGGGDGSLRVTFAPPNASPAVTWTSSNTAAAAVSGSGANATVTPVAAGLATITASIGGGMAATCAVTVVPPTPGGISVFIAGGFGLYMDGVRDMVVGDQDLRDVFVDAQGNVHATGYHRSAGAGATWNAAHYRNGEMTLLPTSHGGHIIESGARKVFVADNGDVYVAGYERFLDEHGRGASAARLWKNNVQVPLQGVDETGPHFSNATSVRLHGGDVYVGGHSNEIDGHNRPVIWKNDERHLNGTMEDYSVVDFAVGPGGVLAVVCFNDHYDFWGIPAFTAWRVQPDLETWEETPLVGNPMQVFIDGTDVYFAGYDHPHACYWKNGEQRRLPSPPGAGWAEADDMHVVNGHAYIGGHAGCHVVQWIDGEMVTDSRAVAGEFGRHPSVSGVFAK